MFITSTIKDTVALHPSTFGLAPTVALEAALNKKYANKVLHDIGLCICVFDLLFVGEGKVRYGDGALWYKVTFRLVVFRPFPSEVIIAKVKSSSEDGIRLTLGFFDDIFIPLHFLPTPCVFDPSERSFFWIPDAEESADPPTLQQNLLDTPLTSRMYIESHDNLRVRVESDAFYDDEPGPPKANEGIAVVRERRRSPYTVMCSIVGQGLGPMAWWSGSTSEEADEGAVDGMEEA